MPEYYVHILNWPCTAETPEEAAKQMYHDVQQIVHPVFTVTDAEVEVSKLYHPSGERDLKLKEDFDAEEWYDEDGKELE